MDRASVHCPEIARRGARRILSQPARRAGGSERGKQASHPLDRGGADGPPLCTALKSAWGAQNFVSGGAPSGGTQASSHLVNRGSADGTPLFTALK